MCMQVKTGSTYSISISTRPCTNHRPVWPRPHVNIVKTNTLNEASAILFTIGLRRAGILFRILHEPIGNYWLIPTKILFRILQEPIGSYWPSSTKILFRILQEPIGSYWPSPTKILFRILQEPIGNYWLIAAKNLSRILQESIRKLLT